MNLSTGGLTLVAQRGLPLNFLHVAISGKFGAIFDMRTAIGRFQGGPTDLRGQIVFLGLRGSCPGPESDMLLHVSLPGTKKDNWSNRVGELPKSGPMSDKELGSPAGRLSYSQTSIIGRFGRARTQSLYRKLNTEYCKPELSDFETAHLQRKKEILTAKRPLVIYIRRNTPRGIIYAGAATSARIASYVLFGR